VCPLAYVLLLLLVQGKCRLEQYLQQDLQRYIDMREELKCQASGCDAAVLSVLAQQQLHARTSSSSGSFVRFPKQHMLHDEDEDAAAAAPLAPAAIAAAAAAAMAAVRDPAASVAASTAHAARVSWDSSSAATPSGMLAQQQTERSEAAAAGNEATVADQGQEEQQQSSAGQLPFAMEDDAEIAAQKLAARAKLAQLEGGEASATAAEACVAAAAAPLPAGKAAAGKCLAEDEDGCGYEPGSVHSSRVPQRPRGLTGLVHSQRSSGAADSYSLAMGLQGKGENAMFGSAATRLQAVRFFQTMAAGLLLCLALLPALWALQVGAVLFLTGPGMLFWVAARHAHGARVYYDVLLPVVYAEEVRLRRHAVARMDSGQLLNCSGCLC
jgi:hypothetical protein